MYRALKLGWRIPPGGAGGAYFKKKKKPKCMSKLVHLCRNRSQHVDGENGKPIFCVGRFWVTQPQNPCIQSSKGWTLFNYRNEKCMHLSYVPLIFLYNVSRAAYASGDNFHAFMDARMHLNATPDNTIPFSMMFTTRLPLALPKPD
jgi:hypothetical protein